jgi:NADPH:quinone reductase-like Zn-dependent oxidoreductase
MMEPAAGSRRLVPGTPRRFWLTCTASVGALAAVAFGAVTRNVVGHDGIALHDPHVGLIEDGKLLPVVDRTYPLAEAAEGLRTVEQGHARGKIVVTVA